jgi:hypothetical protein
MVMATILGEFVAPIERVWTCFADVGSAQT